jgi:hypothetical protein
LLDRGSQLVDLGCSNGGFLVAARSAFGLGPSSYGVEVSEPNVEAARRAGLRVERELCEVEPRAVVTFWHSAEHFPVRRLIELIGEIRERSSARATLLVSVPNGASAQWRVTRRRWAYYDESAHYSQFTPDSLVRVLDAGGWRAEQWHRSPVYGLFGAVQSSINLLRPRNELYDALKRGEQMPSVGALTLNGLAAAVSSPLAVGLSAFEMSTRACAVLTVVARAR